MRGACSASPSACLLPRTMAPFIAQRRNCKRAAPTRHSPLVVLARPSGKGLLALASPPVRSHALPSLLARSPGGGASYGGDPVLAWLRCERATRCAATWGHRGRALDRQP